MLKGSNLYDKSVSVAKEEPGGVTPVEQVKPLDITITFNKQI